MKKLNKFLLLVSAWLLFFKSLIEIPVYANNSIDLKASSYMVFDTYNGQILASNNEDASFSIGVSSKLMTLYLVYEKLASEDIKLSDKVSISDKAYAFSQDYGIQNVPLRQDEVYTVEELLEAVEVGMANGAALALCEFTYGSEENFVARMNQVLKSWEFDASSNYFKTATGLSTAYIPQESESLSKGEFGRLSTEALATVTYNLLHNYPEVLLNSKEKSLMFRKNTSDKFEIHNPNWLVKGLPYGHSDVNGLVRDNIPLEEEANGHIVISAKKGDLELAIVIMQAQEADGVFIEGEKLLDYCLGGFVVEDVIQKESQVKNLAKVPVVNGKVQDANLIAKEDLVLVVPLIDTSPRLEYRLDINDDLANEDGRLIAPLEKGTYVGDVVVNVRDYDLRLLPTAKGNRFKAALAEDVYEVNGFVKFWRSITGTFSSVWDSIRSFFVDLFN